MSNLSVALLVFSLSYLLIVTERIHKTVVALTGAALMIALGVLTQQEAFYSQEFGVDYNVIFLLVGMMIIVNIVRDTGLFEVLAIRAAQLARAEPFRLLVLLAVATAALSAMLDNVTTVLLMAPVTLAITQRLALQPIPFLIVEAVASNIGGTATLVGDPPNIMIASKAGFGYLDVLSALAPIAAVIMGGFVCALWWFTGGAMRVDENRKESLVAMNAWEVVQDPAALKRALWMLGAINVAFCIHGLLHLEPATVALLGASAFMLFGQVRQRNNGQDMTYLMEVEWKTIFFFIGLFVLVGGLVKVGVIHRMAEWLIGYAGRSPVASALIMLWGSALLSAIIDNIPYVAAMNPLIVDLARALHPDIADYAVLVRQPDVLPLWWALALGACLGGNGTLIGASANVVVVDLARRAGYPITFWQFMKVGFPVMMGSILLSTLYLWLVFLR